MTARPAIRRRTGRRPPAVLLVPAVLGLALFSLPLIGLLGRVPWADLPSLLESKLREGRR